MEMRLRETSAYFRKADEVFRTSLPLVHRMGFIWTEDPSVFDYVMRRGLYHNRTKAIGVDETEWLWYDSPNRTDFMSYGTWGTEKTLPFGVLMDEWFLNVLTSLECDWFIGTWESNQDRLLNELVGVLLPKPIVDLEPGLGERSKHFFETNRR